MPHARAIPLATVTEALDGLDPLQPVVVYCESGYRSQIAASVLVSRGFTDVSDVMGGYTAWRDAGLHVMTDAAIVTEAAAARRRCRTCVCPRGRSSDRMSDGGNSGLPRPMTTGWTYDPELVEQAMAHERCGEVGATDAQVSTRLRLERLDVGGDDLPRQRGVPIHTRERLGEHDLGHVPPDPRELDHRSDCSTGPYLQSARSRPSTRT